MTEHGLNYKMFCTKLVTAKTLLFCPGPGVFLWKSRGLVDVSCVIFFLFCLAVVHNKELIFSISSMLQISFVSKIWFWWQVGHLSFSIYLEIIDIVALPTSCQMQLNGWMFGWLLFACGLLMQRPHVTLHLLQLDHVLGYTICRKYICKWSSSIWQSASGVQMIDCLKAHFICKARSIVRTYAQKACSKNV